jgi:hypothetical protein
MKCANKKCEKELKRRIPQSADPLEVMACNLEPAMGWCSDECEMEWKKDDE